MARAYAPVYDHDEERVSIPADAFTFEGFQRWMASGELQETGRIDYLAGVVEVDSSPEDLQTHGVLKLEIGSKLHELIGRGRLGQVFTDSTRVTNAPAALSTEPDVVVVLWEPLRSGRARYVTPTPGQPGRLPEIEGSPDLVVEVVSRSSERKDRKVLPDLYAKAGIPELWLADARGAKSASRSSPCKRAAMLVSSPTIRAGSSRPASACDSASAASPTSWSPPGSTRSSTSRPDEVEGIRAQVLAGSTLPPNTTERSGNTTDRPVITTKSQPVTSKVSVVTTYVQVVTTWRSPHTAER